MQDAGRSETGARLHHEVVGTGGTGVVLVHGLGCAGEDWAQQVEALAPRHRTMTVDLRGHGRSTGFEGGFDVLTAAADVAELAREHALAPAVIVGHSMGCRVAVEAARIAPETFRGVVLVDGSALAHAPGSERPAVDFARVRGALFDAMFLPGSDPALRERIVERANAVDVRVGQSFHDSMVAYDAERMESALGELDVPVAVVQSTYMNPDRVRVPIEPGMQVPWLDLVGRAARDARIEVVTGVGHFTMLEAPDTVTSAIEQVAGRFTH